MRYEVVSVLDTLCHAVAWPLLHFQIYALYRLSASLVGISHSLHQRPSQSYFLPRYQTILLCHRRWQTHKSMNAKKGKLLDATKSNEEDRVRRIAAAATGAAQVVRREVEPLTAAQNSLFS
jgi:hypothetical protein